MCMKIYILTEYCQPDYYGFFLPRGATTDETIAKVWKYKDTDNYDYVEYDTDAPLPEQINAGLRF